MFMQAIIRRLIVLWRTLRAADAWSKAVPQTHGKMEIAAVK